MSKPEVFDPECGLTEKQIERLCVGAVEAAGTEGIHEDTLLAIVNHIQKDHALRVTLVNMAVNGEVAVDWNSESQELVYQAAEVPKKRSRRKQKRERLPHGFSFTRQQILEAINFLKRNFSHEIE